MVYPVDQGGTGVKDIVYQNHRFVRIFRFRYGGANAAGQGIFFIHIYLAKYNLGIGNPLKHPLYFLRKTGSAPNYTRNDNFGFVYIGLVDLVGNALYFVLYFLVGQNFVGHSVFLFVPKDKKQFLIRPWFYGIVGGFEYLKIKMFRKKGRVFFRAAPKGRPCFR